MQQCVSQISVIQNIRKMFASPCSTDIIGPSTSASEDDTLKVCVCHVVTPIFRLCQVFGILPVTFRENKPRRTGSTVGQLYQFHKNSTGQDSKDGGGKIGGITTNQQKKKECQAFSSWISFPSIANILWVFGYASVTTWAFSQLHLILRVYFEGTDLYTFGTQTICLYAQANLILINAFMQREKFCEIWALLLQILKKLFLNPCFKLNQFENNSKPSESPPQPQFPLVPPVTALHNFVVASTLLHHLEYQCPSNHQTQATTPFIENDNQFIKQGYQLQKRFKQLKVISFVIMIIIIILSTSHVVTFFNLVFTACFDKTVEDSGLDSVVFGKPPCPLNNFLLLLQKCCYGMIDFVQQSVALLFGTLCMVICFFFGELEEQLEKLFKSFNCGGKMTTESAGVPLYRHLQVQHLRLLYDDLSRVCRLMSQCFGLAIISVLITSVVSITCALYSFALYSGAIEKSERENVLRFYVIWAFHGWFGCFSLILVLIPGQLITNAVN